MTCRELSAIGPGSNAGQRNNAASPNQATRSFPGGDAGHGRSRHVPGLRHAASRHAEPDQSISSQPQEQDEKGSVQAFFNSRLSAGDSIAKVRVMRVVLSAALTRAMREELVSRNVARLVTLPPAPARDRRPWSVEEARRFLQVARRDPLHAAFTFLPAYGLRRGEVLGLSWDDVDLDQGVIHVRRQVVRAGGQLHLGPVKTTAGVRELPLLEIARDALIEHEAKQLLGNSVSEWDRERLIFTTASGRPVEPRNIGRSFERIVRKAGVRPIRLHDLRHTTASLLKKLGVSPRDAMVILGHSNISVTLGIYTHVDEDSRRDALDRLGQALRPPGPAASSPVDTAVAVNSAVTPADLRAREDQG